MSTPLLHTPEEAAELLRCTASWLKERARRRDVPVVLIGGSYRFSDAHLIWIIKHFEQQPAQAGRPENRTPHRRTPTAPGGVVQLRARPPRRRTS